MAYVVAATWKAKPGQEDRVAELVRAMRPLSQAEDKNLFYEVHQDPEDPRTFFLYEQYVDESGFEAHRASEHFQAYVVGEALPLLETRSVAIYRTLE
jgi:quinol monooxygenase YgiN